MGGSSHDSEDGSRSDLHGSQGPGGFPGQPSGSGVGKGLEKRSTTGQGGKIRAVNMIERLKKGFTSTSNKVIRTMTSHRRSVQHFNLDK